MAVLIEAISVLIKRTAIDEKFPGGWEAFVENAPNQTLCADSILARVGFMIPVDVESFIRRLKRMGFIYIEDGEAVDMVVVDQQRGFAARCSWAGFGHCDIGDDHSRMVAACQSADDLQKVILCPDGWKYEGSLSHTYGSAPTESVDESLEFLRHEDGLDVYLNKLTGKEVYVGRTDKT